MSRKEVVHLAAEGGIELSGPPFSQSEGFALETALRKAPVFSDLTAEQLQWLKANSEVVRLPAGEVLYFEGRRVDWIFALLEGEALGRRETAGANAQGHLWRAGQVLGLLALSHIVSPVTARLTKPSWILRLHKTRFEEMFHCIPQLTPRMIDLVVYRVQEGAALNYRRDDALSPEERAVLTSFEKDLPNRAASAPVLDALEQFDREQDLEAWLNRHGVANATQLASELVSAGVNRAALAEVGATVRGHVLSELLSRAISSYIPGTPEE